MTLSNHSFVIVTTDDDKKLKAAALLLTVQQRIIRTYAYRLQPLKAVWPPTFST
jgi:hypothetical protein